MNFEFGIKSFSTEGRRSAYHEPDNTLRLFVSVTTSESGKTKGKFKLTEGAMNLMLLSAGGKVAIAKATEDTPAGCFHLANVTELDTKSDGTVSKQGTFYNLKLVELLQKIGALPEEIGDDENPVIIDVSKVNSNPVVVLCKTRKQDSANAQASFTSVYEKAGTSDVVVEEEEVDEVDEVEVIDGGDTAQDSDAFPFGEDII